MAAGVNRRQLIAASVTLPLAAVGGWTLRSYVQASTSAKLLRPPGAFSWQHFLSACIRCTSCIQACPQECIVPQPITDGWATLGMPTIDARSNPCDLCQGRQQLECIVVCPTAALQEVVDRRSVRIGVAEVDPETCLPFIGVACRACWHACPLPNEAIRVDELGRPEVIDTDCVGCGLCEHACLAEEPAIRVKAWSHGPVDN